DEPRHDERAVAHAVDLRDARADRSAEHDEVERRRDDGRDDALHERAPGARHLEQVDRFDGVQVHLVFFTRSTKMSSSELCVVSRSENRTPASLISRKSDVMPVRPARVSYVNTSSVPSGES